MQAVLEYSRNARKQCWNTVEMHTEKVLEHSRNARKNSWNTVEVYTEKVLVCSRNARKQCWNTVGMYATMLEIVYTVFQHFLHAFLCEKRQMKRVEHDHDAKTLRSQRFGITRAQNTTRILLEYYKYLSILAQSFPLPSHPASAQLHLIKFLFKPSLHSFLALNNY